MRRGLWALALLAAAASPAFAAEPAAGSTVTAESSSAAAPPSGSTIQADSSAASAPAAVPAEPAFPPVSVKEHPAKRFENVFFISLPFTSLYSAVLTLAAAAIIQKGDVDFTEPYQFATAGLAASGALYIAWQDTARGGPSLSEVKRKEPGQK